LLAALLAGKLVPAASNPSETERRRRRARLAGLWLASLCPFLANYCAVILAEVPATFCVAAALVAFSSALAAEGKTKWAAWFGGGLATAVGTLFRPESPILLVALAAVCLWRWRHRYDWGRLARVGAMALCGFVLPLVPWTVRNAITLHEFQFLAPRYANQPGDFVPRGFFAWTNTWMVRYRYAYTVIWKLLEEEIPPQDIPNSAFDNANEKQRVYALLNDYNEHCCNPPTADWDAQFAQLARERTRRHPLRTYLRIPVERAFVLWFTPRIELLPYTGNLWPPRYWHEQDPDDFDYTLLLWVVGFVYGGMAVAGFVRAVRKLIRQPGAALRPQVWVLAFLVGYCLIRTAYLTHVETTEPRYVLECFPVVFALAAQLFLRPTKIASLSASSEEQKQYAPW
jgi:4-amino-4-deoxy-L-arabinose transferase-like glycosyltransferase